MNWPVRLMLIVVGALVARRAVGGLRPGRLPRLGLPNRSAGPAHSATLPAPEAVVGDLDLAGGMHLAVVGAIQHYAGPLARVVGPDGRVHAVGSGAAMLDQVEAALWREQITNVRLWPGTAGRLPLGDGSVDRLLWTIDPAEQLVDGARALNELFRALRPGGRAVIVLEDEGKAGDVLGAAEQAGFLAEARQDGLLVLRRP